MKKQTKTKQNKNKTKQKQNKQKKQKQKTFLKYFLAHRKKYMYSIN